MAKIITGYPPTNTHGNTRDTYTLIQVLSDQLDAVNPTFNETSLEVTAVDGEVLLVTTGAVSNLAINLPTAADSVGVRVTIKKVDAAAKSVIVTPDAAEETIDGATTLTLAALYDVVTLQCDGTVWHIISSNIA
jgi:hypothetical protein